MTSLFLFYIIFCQLNASGLCCAFICFISVFAILSFSHRIMFSAFYKFSPACWAIYSNPVLWRLSLTLQGNKMVHVWICIFLTFVPSVVFCLLPNSMPVCFPEWKWASVFRCWLMCDLQLLTTNTPSATRTAILLTNHSPFIWNTYSLLLVQI